MIAYLLQPPIIENVMPTTSTENHVWKASPSQWLNIGPYSFCILLTAVIIAIAIYSEFPATYFALLIPILYAVWRYLSIRCQAFELTNERLRIYTGVINQSIDEVELYRVKDILVIRKWWMRLTGLGNVNLETSDRSLPSVEIHAIRDCFGVREHIRELVEAMREKKRVREIDFDETGDTELGDMGEMG